MRDLESMLSDVSENGLDAEQALLLADMT
ncbi:MAG: hypothetical protein ACJAW0_001573, partial [Zhongshania sp.]